ncbi:MAG: integrase [Verrucomicrobiales bacterium]|jgi:integrase
MTKQDRSICPVSAQSRPSISRTQVAYWRDRVEKVRSKAGAESPNYSARVVFKNRRVRFPLHTPNKEIAASKASKIYTALVERGWEETLVEFKPTEAKKVESTEAADSVGDLIQAAIKYSTAREKSLNEYTKAFRRIVAQIEGIPDGEKFDSKSGNGGAAAWKAMVDAVKLSDITPVRVQAWKTGRLERGGKDASAKRHAIVTVNSLIRNAKALFAKKLMPFLREAVTLPDPLPFEGITMERSPSLRYHSRIDAMKLLELAGLELRESEVEGYKILLLALICGLRVSEIDYLLWGAFDFEHRILRVENSAYHHLKSEDSAGEIDLTEDLVGFFQGLAEQATGEFVIESPGRVDRSIGSYRCQPHLHTLLQWLRANGVDAQKPIHTLRKEVGSIIASEQGIFAASRYLRHSDIRITSAIYADKKQAVIPSISAGI